MTRAAASMLGPLALAGAVGLAGWIALRHRADGETFVLRGVTGPTPVVHGLTGDAEAFTVRLAPMHGDERRQAFETSALRVRFERADGAPYRLELEVADDGKRTRIDLATCRIVDERGAALVALQEERDLSREPGRPVDPLRVLVAARVVELDPGESTRVVLWGRLPESGARLEFEGRDPVALVRSEWAPDAMEDVLARRPMPVPEELGR